MLMEMILKPQMMCLTNALNYLTNWSLIFKEPVLTGGIGTPGRVRPIIVHFRHGVTTQWSIVNRKIASILGSLLT